jgi:two-component system response regulator AtoC
MDKVLLVDNKTKKFAGCSNLIQKMGMECIRAETIQQAKNMIRKISPRLVVTGLKMPGQNGMDLVKYIHSYHSKLPVIVFTRFPSIETAIQAMKLGAHDYINPPLSEQRLKSIFQKALNTKDSELRMVKASAEETNNIMSACELIYQSAIMEQIHRNIRKLSQSDATVFIFGESGTGKEVIARCIHHESHRKDHPFIPLDCVALPSTLLESELFGYEKGAFTGAYRSKPGVFELAEKGTLFLDEVTEMDIHLQAKLLRVIQERQFRRIGGGKFTHVDVRIVSATNKNIENSVMNNKIREDLLYRLNVIPIHVPPLRERREDIPLLVNFFMKKYNSFSPREIKHIEPKAMEKLISYQWPGNVRELENLMQRVMFLKDNDIIAHKDLPAKIRNTRKSSSNDNLLGLNYKQAKKRWLDQFNHSYLEGLIQRCNGNLSRVSRIAGVSRRTLYRMLDEYNISRL